MTEGGYTREEILKGERIILQVRRRPAPFAVSAPVADLARDRASSSTSLHTVRHTRGCAGSARPTTTTSRPGRCPSSSWRSPCSTTASSAPSRA